jgi:hypothetical protein
MPWPSRGPQNYSKSDTCCVKPVYLMDEKNLFSAIEVIGVKSSE